MAQLGQDYLGDFQLGPVSFNSQESKIIWADNEAIATATADFTIDAGSPDLYLGVSNTWDGIYTWEQVTNRVRHNFTASGKFLKWKVEGTGVTISRIEVQVNS